MEKNSLVFIAICVVFYLAYSQYLNTKYPDRLKPATHTTELASSGHIDAEAIRAPTSADASLPIGSDAPTTSAVAMLSTDELTIKNDNIEYIFDQHNGGIAKIVLSDFQSEDHDSDLQLLTRPLELQALSGNQVVVPGSFRAKRQENTVTFETTQGDWLVKQEYTVPSSGFGMDLRFTWKNLSSKARELDTTITMSNPVPYATVSQGILGIMPGIPTSRPTVIGSFLGSVDREDVQNYCENSANTPPIISSNNREMDYFGVDLHYFLMALLPEISKSRLEIVQGGRPELDRCNMRFVSQLNQGLVKPGDQIELNYKGWFGPKSDKLMKAFDPRLASAVDLGFFNSVGQLLLAILRWVFSLVGNWGVAIVIFTILLKIVFYPLTRAAHMSMGRMKKLQPQMAALREKFKEDPRRQQQELMQFMSANKVNPAKGCLPILPQIPVFFAFYRVLSSSVELRHAPFVGWISDLSVADPYYITPVLLAIGMFLQQKLTPTTGMDKTQERIMMMLPLMFGVMMISLPAGLVIYMLTNTIVSISQQQWLNRRLA